MSGRALHKIMRDRVRREVRSSPMLSREYARRRPAAWKRWWLTGPPGWILVVPGAIAGPTALGCFLAASILPGFLPQHVRVIGDPQSRALWSLVALSVCLAGFSVIIATALLEQIWKSVDLSVLVHFPVEDRNYSKRQLVRVVGGSAISSITIGIVLGAVAAVHHGGAAVWMLVGVFTALGWLTVAATAILVSAYFPWGIYTDFVGVGALVAVVISGLALGGGGPQSGVMPPSVACAILALSPPGWISAAFYFGAIEGSMAAWLFLLPAASVIGLAARWLFGTFTIREVTFFDGRANIAAIEGSMRLATPRFWDQRRYKFAARTRYEPKLSTPNGTYGSGAIVTEEFLRPRSWSRLSWVERFVAARLTERQRLLLECYNSDKPYWTRFWLASLAIGAVAALVIFLPSDAKDRSDLLVDFMTILALAVATFNAPRHGPRSGGWHAYYPVGFGELSRALALQALWRGAAAIPVMLALNVVGALLGGRPVVDTLLVFAACCPVAFGWYLFGCCLFSSSSTNDTANRWIFVGWLTATIVLVSLSLAAISPLGVFRLISGGAALLLAWAMWRRYAWMLDHAGIDIVR